MILVNNFEKLEISPYVQVNNLVGHSFIGAGRRHKTPRSETKDSLLTPAIAVASESVFLPVL